MKKLLAQRGPLAGIAEGRGKKKKIRKTPRKRLSGGLPRRTAGVDGSTKPAGVEEKKKKAEIKERNRTLAGRSLVQSVPRQNSTEKGGRIWDRADGRGGGSGETRKKMRRRAEKKNQQGLRNTGRHVRGSRGDNEGPVKLNRRLRKINEQRCTGNQETKKHEPHRHTTNSQEKLQPG